MKDNNDTEKNSRKKQKYVYDKNILPVNIIRVISRPPNIPPPESSPPIPPIIINEEEEVSENYYNDEDYDEIISREINSIDDLIELGKLYNIDNPRKRKKYNINVKRLYDLIEPLEELKNMIGMKKVKEHIVDMIVYYLQDFEKENKNMMHTVLYGPPGCGKTELAHILAKIYCKMGILKKDKVHVVRRSDLIGKYLGHTAVNTQKAIDEALGGVLLIDEAYSLENSEQRDSYSKECIDTLNQNLTENKEKFICIIAGYKKALEECFFSYNQGLYRRFQFKFTIDNYDENDLKYIYIKKVEEDGWKIGSDEDTPIKFFKDNRELFKYNGGDMETLFHLTKIVHARRVFCLPKKEKKIINYKDLEKALTIFNDDDFIRNRNNKNDDLSNLMMYC